MSCLSGARILAAILTAAFALGCGSAAPPTTPTPPPAPAVTVASVQVGVAGNAEALLTPGLKLQLWALATNSDGSTSDVTNTATWQSSSPALATISTGGLLSAAAEGSLDVTATYQNRTGTLHAEVRKPGCDASLSIPSLTFGAFGGSGKVDVMTGLTDCRWTARSDASWLSFSYDPNRSGSGSFTYSVPPNNGPQNRTARIVVSVAGAGTAIHAVTQERPVSCSYVVTPAKVTLSANGGQGGFDVTATPNDCEWTVDNRDSEFSSVPLVLTGPTGGRGTARVTYSWGANTFAFSVTRTIYIRGLSGVNPPGVHTVTIPTR